MLNKLKQALLYAGIEKEQFNMIYPEVQKRNLKNLSIYSLGMSIYFVLFLVYAIIATGLIEIFGAESSYRIGGDEFVSYTDCLDKKQIEAALDGLVLRIKQPVP